MIASDVSSARIALRIGSSIAATVPNVSVRITIAAMIPISSLDSVEGLETFCPSWPPVSTSRPAALAGSAASMIFCASSTESSPGADGERDRQVAGALVLAQRRGALGRQRVDDRGDVRRLRDVGGGFVDRSRVAGSVSLPLCGVQHDRARAVRLVGERLRERVRRALAVGAGQRQVVVGVFAEPMRDGDQRDRGHEPDAEHRRTGGARRTARARTAHRSSTVLSRLAERDGARGARTLDLRHAMAALSQLSYSPEADHRTASIADCPSRSGLSALTPAE